MITMARNIKISLDIGFARASNVNESKSMIHTMIFWVLPASALRKFDEGEVIEDCVPVSWALHIGDTLAYEAGSNISGTAVVISVGKKISKIVDPLLDSDDFEEDEVLPMISVVTCGFRKVS